MPRVAFIILLGSFGLLTQSACGSVGQDRIDPALTADSSCAGIRIPVRREADSIPHDRACSYVVSAMDALRLARPDSVILAPADTAAVSSATVDAIAQIDTAGAPVASWWLVTFRLTGKPYDAEVRFNQKTGERTIRPIHK